MPREPVTILAVDDIPENLAALDALLTREGLRMLRASSGEEALELLLVHDVALALLDVQMPGMDGFELAELMRGTERTRGVPIIFLTAVATDESRRFRGFEAGAVDYLLKPVDPQIVRNKVDVFVELYAQRRELARQRDRHAAALARLSAHIDNSPLAVVEFDADGRIIGWSKGAERMFGWRAAEVAGFRGDELHWIDPDDARAFAALIAGMIGGGAPRETRPLRMRTAEGVVLDCEVYCSALLDAFGRLVSVNAQILDVTDRKRAEETQRLLIGELNHRIQNLFAVVQAVALHSLGGNRPLVEAREVFIDRLQSLGRAYTLMTEQEWRGAPLRQILAAEISAFADRVSFDGVDLMVRQNAAQSFALLLHELTTNAVKYGALSAPGGRVDVRWTLNHDSQPVKFILSWEESGGPLVAPPTRSGYGRKIIEDTIRRIGKHQIDYAPTGMKYRMEAPLEKVGWVIENPGAAQPEKARSGS